MSEYLLGVTGIFVSIVLFVIGYRQTIGAKKERIRSANNEIEKILVRRIVLEEFTPRLEDIVRLIDGKGRDFRVRPADLLSEEQFLNNIFTRIVETDFIPREQREQVLARLSTIIDQAAEQPIPEETLEAFPSQTSSRRLATILMGVMGAFASVVGALLAALPELRQVEGRVSELLPLFFGTATGSLVAIIALIIVYRLRERQQEEPSKGSIVSSYVEFEREVVKMLIQLGFTVKVASPQNRDYDLIVERGGRKTLLELKAWPRQVPSRVVSMVLERLRAAAFRENAAEAILLTRAPVRTIDTNRQDERVKVMTVRHLRNYLADREGK